MQSVAYLTEEPHVSGSIPSTATFVSPFTGSRRTVVNYWQKYVHLVLVNHLGGLSLPRNSVVKLTDHPDMTIAVYHGQSPTEQQQ